jgi:transposase
MDQVHVVRHKVLIEGQSQRAVARALGLSRVTVRRTQQDRRLSRTDSDCAPVQEAGAHGHWSVGR